MRELRAHVGHGERRGVRREDAVGASHGFQGAEDLPFHVGLLEHRFEYQVASREEVVRSAPGDERGEEAGLRLGESSLRDQDFELFTDPGDGVIDLLLGEVAEYERHFEAVQEEQPELPGHQSRADDADLRDPRRLGFELGGRTLHATLDDVESVDRRLRLGAGKELGERVLLGEVALLERPGGGAFDEVEGAMRGGRGAVNLVVDLESGAAADLRSVGEIGDSLGLRRLLLDPRQKKRERLVDELHGLEERICEPELERLRASQHAVLAHGVRHDQLDRALGADQARNELRPAPAGNDPERDLG